MSFIETDISEKYKDKFKLKDRPIVKFAEEERYDIESAAYMTLVTVEVIIKKIFQVEYKTESISDAYNLKSRRDAIRSLISKVLEDDE